MELLKVIFLYEMIFFVRASQETSITEQQQERFDENLRVLSKDFNKLVENVEDFAIDFVEQIQKAGSLIENSYTNNEDYNWQDDDKSTPKPLIKKLEYKNSKRTHKNFLTSSETTDMETTTKKYINNEILRKNDKRHRRSIQEVNNFENTPTDFMRNDPQSVMPPGFEQRQPLPIDRNQVLQNQKLNDVLGIQQVSKQEPDSDKVQICATKTNQEIEMEKLKLEELQSEIKKLDELITILKDQQKIIKVMGEENIRIKNSDVLIDPSLYKTMNMLKKKVNEGSTTPGFTSNIPDQENSLAEIQNIKSDIKKTNEELHNTKEILQKEKERDDSLEIELKRQKNKLKYLTRIIENIAMIDDDASLASNNNVNSQIENATRNGNLKDIDSIVGIPHTLKPFPKLNHADQISSNSRSKHKFTLSPNAQLFMEDLLNNKTDDEMTHLQLSSEDIDNIFKEVHSLYVNPQNPERFFNEEYEEDILNGQTTSALMQMTKNPEYLKMLNSTSGESRNLNENMSRILSILKKPDGTTNTLNNKNTENNRHTVKKSGVRVSLSPDSGINNLNLKLKLIELLTNEAKLKSDNTNIKEKRINDALQNLLLPEQKSDEDLALEKLKALLNDKPPQSTSQEGLSVLLKKLSEKPESKTGSNIDSEIRQLQVAINNLRPKEDNDFPNFDLDNNRKGVPESQAFETMLSQIITRNGVSVQPPTNLASSMGNSDTNLIPQFLNKYSLIGNYPAAINGQSSNGQIGGFMKNYQSLPYLNFLESNSYPFNSPTYDSNSFVYYNPYSYKQIPGNINANAQNYKPLESFLQVNPYSSSNNPDYFQQKPISYVRPDLIRPYADVSSKYISTNGNSLNQIPNFYSAYPTPNYPLGPSQNSNFNDYKIASDVPGQENSYGNTFRPSTGFYPESKYGPKYSPGSSLDESYDNNKEPGLYKYGIIADLSKQIENLENIITNLKKSNNYSQIPNDRAAVAALEQRISELKGVINSINGQNAYEQQANYNQNPTAPQQYYQSDNKGSNQLQYQSNTNKIDPSKTGENPKSYQPSSTNPSNYYRPINEALNVPSQEDHPAASASPQYKENRRKRDQQVTRKDLTKSQEKQLKIRRKRQAEYQDLPLVSETRQNVGNIQEINNSPAHIKYNLGDDTLVQIVNVFKKYLEENLEKPPALPTNELNSAVQSRNSALEGLEQKLNALKLQLGYQKPYPKPLHEWLSQSNTASVPVYYQPESNNGFQNILSGNSNKNDVFSQIVIQIFEKIMNSLPEMLTRIFGDLFNEIGNSYGDNGSYLQTVFKNLGKVGFVPLILIKILESLSSTFQHLKKNQFFSQFLLPGLALGLVGGIILFLIFFFQQSEPYGYIGYQNNDKYYSKSNYFPPYHHNNYYGNYNKKISDYNNNNNYINYREIQNYPSHILNSRNDINWPNVYEVTKNNLANLNNIPFQYNRGYYDYYPQIESQ